MFPANIAYGAIAAAQPLVSGPERRTVKIVMIAAAAVLIALAAGLSAMFPRRRKTLAIVCFVLGGIALVTAAVANWGVLSDDPDVSGMTTLIAGATGLAMLVLGGTFYKLQTEAAEQGAGAGA